MQYIRWFLFALFWPFEMAIRAVLGKFRLSSPLEFLGLLFLCEVGLGLEVFLVFVAYAHDLLSTVWLAVAAALESLWLLLHWKTGPGLEVFLVFVAHAHDLLSSVWLWLAVAVALVYLILTGLMAMITVSMSKDSP